MKKNIRLLFYWQKETTLQKVKLFESFSKNKQTKKFLIKDFALALIEKFFALNSDFYISILRISGNINQIAHHLNSGNYIIDDKKFFESAEDIKQAAQEMTKITHYIKQEMEQII